MKTIYKYPIASMETFCSIPGPGNVVLVDTQDGFFPTVWVEVDTDKDEKAVLFRIFGTGADLPEHGEHVGSAVCGKYVWHVYRMRRVEE